MNRIARAVLPLLLCVPGLSQDVTIRVEAARPAAYSVPRTIFGTFLEPIGNAIYGGLWAQLLENPGFEENLWSVEAVTRMAAENPAFRRASELGLPLPWEPLDAAQGARYEPRWNNAPAGRRSIVLMALPGSAETGIRQQVYLPVHRTLTYSGTLHAKHLSGATQIEISLRPRNDRSRVLARSAIALRGADWARYDFKLALERGSLARLQPADLVISASEETRVALDQVFLWPEDHVSGMDPEMVRLSKELRTPIVRFGGNFTSHYHWRDGVGPIDQRPTVLNLAWGLPEYNHFGTDEFLEYCRLINAEPQIALNLGTGTPQEAAEWVQYVNGKLGRSGLWWELGNELWGDFQIGYPTLERVAPLTRRFSEAVRAADPKARLIATGQDPDHFEKWNAAQLGLPVGTFDMLATHFVVGTWETVRKSPPADFQALTAFALPVELERRLRAMSQQIEASPHAGKVNLAFTEWLFHAWDDRVPRFYNMGGAIATAGMLHTLIRTAEFVPISDMTGIIEFGGIYKKRGRVFGVPAYWAFRMYSTADVTRPVAIESNSETYDIAEGNVRLPNIEKTPYVDVVAALNAKGDRLTVFCISRWLDRDAAVRLNLGGFRAAPRARTTVLSAPSIYTSNTEMEPEAVVPRESGVAVENNTANIMLPRSSVTRLEFDLAR